MSQVKTFVENSWMNKPLYNLDQETQESAQLSLKALESIAEYYDSEFGRYENETFQAYVYDLYNGPFEDNLYGYHDNTLSLILAFAQPEVQKVLKTRIDITDIVNMLGRLEFFFRRMNSPFIKPLLLMERINRKSSEFEHSKLEEIIQEYSERAKVSKEAKFKNYY